jgi:energy-coupling factor transporter ATP-binding protein EcfA2
MPDLVRVSVEGLLGRFNHSFDFPGNWEFIILHGPNGIGKTKLLELISATLSGNPFKIETIPFRQAIFTFNDASVLTVTRADNSADKDGEEESSSRRLTFELLLPDGEVVSATGPTLAAPELRRLRNVMERELPIEQIGPDTWFDHSSNNTLSTIEAINTYSDVLQARVGKLYPSVWLEGNPIRDFMARLSVYFIETQRLLTDMRVRPERYPERPARRNRTTVLELAEDLKSKLREALAQNSRTSQQLDRDFPRRIMLDQQDLPEATDENIQQKYNMQSSLRQQLAEIALLDIQTDLPLPQRTLQDWERRVLWTYLADTEKKLETFIPILERAALLTEIVNARFMFKSLKIDADRGFRFVTDTGTDISPQVLSSGEQHELVLAYELLFQANQGSLVLIDEPEISLHVAWQKAFLDDIVRVAQVSSLRFIIATHSPQIINKWWSRTEALHPGYDGNGDSRDD